VARDADAGARHAAAEAGGCPGQHREALAQLESLCSGKTITLARMLELDQSVAFLRYFAGWAGKVTGETLDVSLPSMAGEKYTAFTRRQPLGVVVGIVPWNFSIMIAIWKLAAAWSAAAPSSQAERVYAADAAARGGAGESGGYPGRGD
jgi:acyl-CoA reductase-like NAD-dependent aldehyde dehydrogenase